MFTIEEINEYLRQTLRANRKVIRAAKLPGTVVNQFIKSDSKQLTINTLAKIAEFVDAELIIAFKDKESGEYIMYDEVEKRMVEKTDANKKHQKTEELIAGVTDPTGSTEETDTASTSTDIEELATDPVNTSIESTETIEKVAKTESPDEFDIDLEEIFGGYKPQR